MLFRSGEMFVREGASILSIYSNLLSELGRSNERYERIIVSASSMYSKHYFPAIYSEFTTLYPHVELQLVESHSKDRIKMLHNREVDFIVSIATAVEGEFDYRFLYQEEIVLAMSEQTSKRYTHAIYKKNGKEFIDLSALQNEKFVSYQQLNNMLEVVTEICREAGFVPQVIFRSSNSEVLCTMVQCGMGIGIIPLLAASYSSAGSGVHYYRIESKHAFRNYVLAYNSDALNSPGCRNYIELAEKMHSMGIGLTARDYDSNTL